MTSIMTLSAQLSWGFELRYMLLNERASVMPFPSHPIVKPCRLFRDIVRTEAVVWFLTFIKSYFFPQRYFRSSRISNEYTADDISGNPEVVIKGQHPEEH